MWAQALLRFTCVLGLVIVKRVFRKWKISQNRTYLGIGGMFWHREIAENS